MADCPPGGSCPQNAGLFSDAIIPYKLPLISQLQLPFTTIAPFPLRMVYASNAAADVTSYGAGWRLNLAQTLSQDVDGHAALWKFVGQYFYENDGSNNFTAQGGIRNTLIKNADGTWKETQLNRREFHFDTGGKLGKVVDRAGNVCTLSYDEIGRASCRERV